MKMRVKVLSSQIAILVPNFANQYQTIAVVAQIDTKEWAVEEREML